MTKIYIRCLGRFMCPEGNVKLLLPDELARQQYVSGSLVDRHRSFGSACYKRQRILIGPRLGVCKSRNTKPGQLRTKTLPLKATAC